MIYRSRLSLAFKIATVPIFAWLIVGLSYLRPVASDMDTTAMQMMRSVALLMAVLGTLYVPIALLALKLWSLRHAK